MVVVGDIETDGLYDAVTRIWCGVFKDVKTGSVYRFGPYSLDKMCSFLDRVTVLIMHNGAQYDLPVLEKILGYHFKGRLIDTLAVSRIERPLRRSHSLDSWGETLKFPKKDFDEWGRYSQTMMDYCVNDVELTFRLAEELGCDDKILTRHKVVSTLFANLFKQEQNGWRVDRAHIDHCIYMLDRWMEKIRKATFSHLPIIPEPGKPINKPFKRDGNLSVITRRYCEEATLDGESIRGPFNRVSFRRVSLDKPSEIKRLLLDQGWKPELWNHDKEGTKTSPKLSIVDSFEGIEGRFGKLCVKYTQCKQRRAILLGWKERQRDDGRLSARVVGLAVTSRARHSIVANIPRNSSFFGKYLRQVFIAREGWKLVGADAEGCQLRMLAARMGDEEYIHRVCTEKVHEVNRELAALDNTDESKKLIYSMIFGASTAKLSLDLGKDASKAKSRLLKELPSLPRLIRDETEKFKATARMRHNSWGKMEYYDGYVVGLDGRRIPINSPHKILMGLLQSDEAILMQYAYNLYHSKLNRLGYRYGIDFGVCCWYHDEIQSECRPELADIIGQLKCDSIEEAGRYLEIPCPMSGSYKVGNNWSETH